MAKKRYIEDHKSSSSVAGSFRHVDSHHVGSGNPTERTRALKKMSYGFSMILAAYVLNIIFKYFKHVGCPEGVGTVCKGFSLSLIFYGLGLVGFILIARYSPCFILNKKIDEISDRVYRILAFSSFIGAWLFASYLASFIHLEGKKIKISNPATLEEFQSIIVTVHRKIQICSDFEENQTVKKCLCESKPSIETLIAKLDQMSKSNPRFEKEIMYSREIAGAEVTTYHTIKSRAYHLTKHCSSEKKTD